ncbi:MAG: PhnD/SsuA/transferrin family substrate-binding protein [Verrucomicrobia bacterium]|nr:PhnD/SsuA/transferrin family substrate-binding protein [Verrucomicrobiota bacterium]
MPVIHHSRFRFRRGACAAALCVLGWAVPRVNGAGDAPVATGEKLRLGFTYAMFAGVNENDAKASIKALAATVARERGIPADPEPLLFHGAGEVVDAVRARRVDAVSLTLGEYQAAAGQAEFDRFLCAVYRDDPTEQYVLLMHRKKPQPTLTGLKGGRIAIFRNPRMSLGRVWLEVELARAGLAEAEVHFARVTENPKLSRVVLDVFFGQSDACLITRRGLATMVELNPQVGRDLVAVLTSSGVVPALFAFRSGFSATLKEKSLQEFSVVHTSTAGQQALVIFQAERVAPFPVSVLEPGLGLLADYARLRPAGYSAYLTAVRRAKPIEEGRLP